MQIHCLHIERHVFFQYAWNTKYSRLLPYFLTGSLDEITIPNCKNMYELFKLSLKYPVKQIAVVWGCKRRWAKLNLFLYTSKLISKVCHLCATNASAT